jgi:dUTP pyrophosphatase
VTQENLGDTTDQLAIPIQAEQVPKYAHPDDAGADLCSAESYTLKPGERALVATGVRIELPTGYAAFVVPRSGLAVKRGVTVLNAPGTIDAGYRGEIRVPLINLDPSETFEIEPGDRIAQMIIMPVPAVRFIPAEQLGSTARGEGGFGSTGVRHESEAGVAAQN